MKIPGRRRTCQLRSGAVIVEVAICAPLLFLLVFASLEFSRVNMLGHTCEIAATEGARRGIIPGASVAEVRQATQRELDIVGATDSTITVEPPVITEATPTVTVTVTVPITSRNGYVMPRFFLEKSLTRSVTLQRETGSDFGAGG